MKGTWGTGGDGRGIRLRNNFSWQKSFIRALAVCTLGPVTDSIKAQLMFSQKTSIFCIRLQKTLTHFKK